MGFRRERRVYTLAFEAGQWAGLEVKAHGVSLGKLFELQELAGREANKEDAVSLIASMQQAIVSWNLEDEDGNPIDPTLDYLLSEDADFILPLAVAWVGSIGSVESPLVENSKDGSGVQEESLPMEPLSENL
jgi:hypothetical protein